MALMQAIALGVVLRRRVTSPWPWLVGPAVSSLVLLAYPPVNTDVFSYASFGWESNKGANPYLIPPMSVPLNPFKTMNDWNHITTPYGPIWTGLSRLLVAMTRDQPFATAIAFKIVAAFSAIGLGIATYFLARRLTRNPAHAVAALVLVAWSPILLAESAGTAHNDAPMMALAVAGLLLATSDRSIAVRGGVPGITAAVLIKPVALPLLALVVVVRIAKSEDGLVAAAKRAVVDLLPAIAFTALAFAPYWSGGKLPSAIVDTQRQLYFDKALHVNPLWVWAFPRVLDWIGAGRLDSQASTISRALVALLLVAAVAIAISPRIRRQLTPETTVLEMSVIVWTAVTVAFGLATINAHAWYAIWALSPVALIWTIRSRTTRTWWLLPYLAWLLMSFLVYHTWPALGTQIS